jgi:hypothetical protein
MTFSTAFLPLLYTIQLSSLEVEALLASIPPPPQDLSSVRFVFLTG